MKRIILTFFFCLGITTLPAVAQFNIGVRAGLNLANASIYSDTDFSSEILPRLNYGVVAEIGLSSALYVQAEAMFSQRGAEATYTFGNVEYIGDLRLDYVEVPITLKYKFGSEGLRPYLFAGPNFAVNTVAEAENASGHKDDVMDEIKVMDIALDAGAGIALETGMGIILMADLRYSFGLQNIINEEEAKELSLVETWKSRDLKLRAGVMISL